MNFIPYEQLNYNYIYYELYEHASELFKMVLHCRAWRYK